MKHLTTYKERANYQLEEWVKGNPIHNDVEDECCPDFSCCKPFLLQPEEKRKQFLEISKKADEEKEGEDFYYELKMKMLMHFLLKGLGEMIPDKKPVVIY